MTPEQKSIETLLKVLMEQNEVMGKLNDRLYDLEVQVLNLGKSLNAVSRKTVGLTMIGGEH